MRSWACQFGVSLAVLIAWPLLGGGEVRAAFLVRTTGASETDSGMTGGDSRSDGESDEHRSPEAPVDPGRFLRIDSLSWAGLGNTASGAGFGGTSVSPDSGGFTSSAAVFSHVNLPPAQLVRWSYFVDVQYRPPPFASRLFRPPRHGMGA
jgi:hypothetical protein